MTRSATRFVTLLVAIVLTGVSSAFAGVSVVGQTYDVINGTYNPISGGTVHATGSSIEGFATTTSIPFTMTWGGSNYTTLTVAGSGQVWIGGTSSNAVWAWTAPITGATNGELSTTTLGSSPNRIFVVQWANMTRSPQGSSNDSYNFQIRLHENGDIAEVVYGSMNVTAAVSPQIGARNGSRTTELTSQYGLNDWTRPHVNAGRSVALDGWAPASGLSYQFSDPGGFDAAVTDLLNPTGKFNAGQSLTVRVEVTNMGANPIDSVTVNWSVNGANRTPVKYYANPALQPGESVMVQLGTVSFGATTFNTVVAWTSGPNGATDANPGNDAHANYLAPRVQGTFNVAQSGANNVFPSILRALRHFEVAGLSGNATVRIWNGNYNEQILVPTIDGGHTVTLIAADGNEPVITWTPSNNPNWNFSFERATHQAYLFDNARVAFENLEFRLTNGLNWGGFVFGDDHSTSSIKGCTFTGPQNFLTQTNPTVGVVLLGGTNMVMNSSFTNLYRGLYISSNDQQHVTGNSFGNLADRGIEVRSARMHVADNMVEASDGSTQFYGILAIGAGMVERNNVAADLSSQANSVVYAMLISSEDSYSIYQDGLTVANNMISAAASSIAVGLQAESYSYSRAAWIYHNSVNITGTAGIGGSAALLSLGGYADFNIVNNIFHNAGTGTNGGVAVWHDGVDIAISDFNNLMTTGAYVGVYDYFYIPRDAGASPLASWRSATGRDNNSSSVAVNFVGGADLHLLQIDNRLFGSSSLKATIPTDIDGETRTIPYMGADEVFPSVRIIEQPISRYACLGEGFQLLCIADVTAGATVTYQWYKDGVKLVGQTGAILPFGSVGYGASGVYTCEVIATDGFNTTAVMSDPASLIVVRNTEITMQPISQPTAPGGTVVLEVAAEAIGAPTDFVPSYQWKKRYWDVQSNSYMERNIVDNGRITGSQSSKLTIRDIEDTDTADVYVCTVTGYCGEATSKQARIFFPTVAASNNTPNACVGGTIQIECAVVPSVIQGSTVSYQWYFNGAALNDGGDISGSDSKVLTISNAQTANNGQYYCLATYSGVGTSIATNTIDVDLGVAPSITGQPTGATVCVGEMVTMTVAADGQNLSYQWMKGSTAVPGAVGASYEIAAASEADAGSYSVMVTNACGDVTSETVDLTVNTPAEITTEPSDIEVYDGDSVRVTVEVSGTEPVTYQWYKDGAEIAGATEASYTVFASASAAEAGEYYCIVTNACGADTSRTAVASIVVGVAGDDVLPGGYTLGLPAPNPTNDVVAFSYSVPSAQDVRITITNMLGHEVATLVNGMVMSGTHRVEISAQDLRLAPGAYTYTFQSKGTVAARQFIVVK